MSEKTVNYIPTLNTLDKAINELIDISLEINDKNKNENSPLWNTHMSKFANTYTKILKNVSIDPFYPMFIKFSTDNLSNLTEPAWDTKTGKAGNEWLKSDKYLDGPGFISKNIVNSSDGFNPILNSRCRGHVIYYNDNPEHYAVSIPISEIYNNAIKLCNKKDVDAVSKTYPIKVLRALYSIVYHSLPDEIDSKKLVENNIKLVSDQLDKMIPNKQNTSGNGNGFNGIGNILQQFAKAAGMDGVNANGIDGLIGNFMKNDGIDKITKVITQVSGAVRSNIGEGDDSADLGKIIGKIGNVLSQSDIQQTASSITTGINDSSNSIFSTSAPATTGINPSSQT
jgi:hypothetical protein